MTIKEERADRYNLVNEGKKSEILEPLQVFITPFLIVFVSSRLFGQHKDWMDAETLTDYLTAERLECYNLLFGIEITAKKKQSNKLSTTKSKLQF